MRVETEPSFYADIYIAGDYDIARHVCRSYCDRGACVTVTKTSFIYTGGEELGIKVGFVNYPRFPKNPQDIIGDAEDLAMMLLEELHQGSCLIQTPAGAKWFSTRKEDQIDKDE